MIYNACGHREVHGETRFKDRTAFLIALREVDRAAGVRLSAPELKAVLAALGERDDPERRSGVVALAHHVQVAHLEHAQREHAPGEQHRTQGEKGQG